MKRITRILMPAAMVLSCVAVAFTQAPPAAGTQAAARRRPWRGAAATGAVGHLDGVAGRRGSADASRRTRREQVAGVRIPLEPGPTPARGAGDAADLRGHLPRHRKPRTQQGHHRHAALVGVQHSRARPRGCPEGLDKGELPDGTRNGPGIMARGGNPGQYFGPGAGPGPFHHYVFEFYALDTKLDLPATATRDDLMKAMEGHVIGKAAYTGRFHAQPQ